MDSSPMVCTIYLGSRTLELGIHTQVNSVPVQQVVQKILVRFEQHLRILSGNMYTDRSWTVMCYTAH